MTKSKIKHFTFPIYFLILIFFIISCTPQKKLIYFQDKGTSQIDSIINAQQSKYKLQPNDVLSVNVQSINEESFSFFNSEQTSKSQNMMSMQNSDGSSILISGYKINDSGYVELPVVGNIHVKDLTVEEAKNVIQKSLSFYLKEIYISVKLLSFKITVLGEVGNPGIYRTFEDKLNIISALSLAGDLTKYGNRQNIMLIRQNEKGKQIRFVDLTNRNILNSEYFYLLPNDVIYVEPLPAKSWGFANAITPITLTLSLISTTVLIINFVK